MQLSPLSEGTEVYEAWTSYFSLHNTGFCFHLLSIKRAKCNRMWQENPRRNLGEQRRRLCSNRDQLEAEPWKVALQNLSADVHMSHPCRDNHCPPVTFRCAAITKRGVRKSGLARRAHKMLKPHCKELQFQEPNVPYGWAVTLCLDFRWVWNVKRSSVC